MDDGGSTEIENSRKIYENNSKFAFNSAQFSFETYFVWFSALIFLTEIVTDLCLVCLYFQKGHLKWAVITLAIIIIPWMMCQIYSVLLLRKDKDLTNVAVVLHLMFLGIPFRYFSIFCKLDKDKINTQEMAAVQIRIREINKIQTVNAIFQYLPQFSFQSYLISFRKYKSIITGVSAGLAGFSFLWYVFIYFYYVFRRQPNEIDSSSEENLDSISSNARIIDNLSPSNNCRNNSNNSSMHSSLKNYEKQYPTNDKNLVSKKLTTKNIEKEQIFSFNKRKPIYKQEDFDFGGDTNNQSLEFFEINDSTASSKLNIPEKECARNPLKELNAGKKAAKKSGVQTDNVSSQPPDNRGSLLKRKGICSSQEMLHLVDIMNDNIAPDQIDALAKSLAELSGEESLNLSSDAGGDLDNSKLLEIFPNQIDEKTLENIDAAIYENQIIFQERIKKNQLTIQNLKLQDEILSNSIDIEAKLSTLSSSNGETMSIHDYENMFYADVNRLNRLKHWKNYLKDLDTNLHDNSTILNSSFYHCTTTTVTTPSVSSYADLYINEVDNQSSSSSKAEKLSKLQQFKKNVQWSDKLTVESVNESCFDEENNLNDGLYVNIVPGARDPIEVSDFVSSASASAANNILETISQINVDSPNKPHHNIK